MFIKIIAFVLVSLVLTGCPSDDGDHAPLETQCTAAAEICDGIDNNCDGSIDEQLIAPLATNQTGVCQHATQVCLGSQGWQDDLTALSLYETSESTCDGLDNDCDGSIDEQLIAPPAGNQNGVCQSAVKVCQGKLGWQDDFSRLSLYETSESTCDGLDNDCDGSIDEQLSAPPAINQNGVCQSATKVCNGLLGWQDNFSRTLNYEANESTCDGLDNDCDGSVDEALTAPLSGNQNGVCKNSVGVCRGALGWQDDLTSIAGYQTNEFTCDALDNDCDGDTDEFLTYATFVDTDNDGIGSGPATLRCSINAGESRRTNDNCPATHNPDQLNTDGDALGDACDPDRDNDGVNNESDNCPLIGNTAQDDWDTDGIGNACDALDGRFMVHSVTVFLGSHYTRQLSCQHRKSYTVCDLAGDVYANTALVSLSFDPTTAPYGTGAKEQFRTFGGNNAPITFRSADSQCAVRTPSRGSVERSVPTVTISIDPASYDQFVELSGLIRERDQRPLLPVLFVVRDMESYDWTDFESCTLGATSTCGNAIRELSELCDGDCPTSCASDNNMCTTDAVSGSADTCDARCDYQPIAAGMPCEGTIACTTDNVCNASGQCVAGAEITCEQDACYTNVSCDPTSSACMPDGFSARALRAEFKQVNQVYRDGSYTSHSPDTNWMQPYQRDTSVSCEQAAASNVITLNGEKTLGTWYRNLGCRWTKDGMVAYRTDHANVIGNVVPSACTPTVLDSNKCCSEISADDSWTYPNWQGAFSTWTTHMRCCFEL